MLEFVFNEVVSHLRVSGYDKVLFSSSAKFCYREWAALVLAGVEGSGVCVCVCVVGRTMCTAHRTKTMPQQAFGIALELRAPRAPVSLPLVIPHCPCTKGRPWALVFFRRPHCFTLSAPWGPGEQLSLPLSCFQWPSMSCQA